MEEKVSIYLDIRRSMAKFEELTQILLNRTPLPELLAPPPEDQTKRVTSKPWNTSLTEQIHQLENDSSQSLFALASLHLFNDDIGSCHDIVDKHSGNDLADYLHYMLHRREGDYWNAKWWIRQLKSEHFRSIYLSDAYRSFGRDEDVSLADAQRRAQTFVDRCEQVEKTNDENIKRNLKELQWNELKTIFKLTCQ